MPKDDLKKEDELNNETLSLENSILYKLKVLNQNIDRLLTILNKMTTLPHNILFLQKAYTLKEIINLLIDKLDDYLETEDKQKELSNLLEEVENAFIELLIKIDTTLGE